MEFSEALARADAIEDPVERARARSRVLDLSIGSLGGEIDLAGYGDHKAPYDWAHGFIPLTPAAKAVKAKKATASKAKSSPSAAVRAARKELSKRYLANDDAANKGNVSKALATLREKDPKNAKRLQASKRREGYVREPGADGPGGAPTGRLQAISNNAEKRGVSDATVEAARAELAKRGFNPHGGLRKNPNRGKTVNRVEAAKTMYGAGSPQHKEAQRRWPDGGPSAGTVGAPKKTGYRSPGNADATDEEKRAGASIGISVARLRKEREKDPDFGKALAKSAKVPPRREADRESLRVQPKTAQSRVEEVRAKRERISKLTPAEAKEEMAALDAKGNLSRDEVNTRAILEVRAASSGRPSQRGRGGAGGAVAPSGPPAGSKFGAAATGDTIETRRIQDRIRKVEDLLDKDPGSVLLRSRLKRLRERLREEKSK